MRVGGPVSGLAGPEQTPRARLVHKVNVAMPRAQKTAEAAVVSARDALGRQAQSAAEAALAAPYGRPAKASNLSRLLKFPKG